MEPTARGRVPGGGGGVSRGTAAPRRSWPRGRRLVAVHDCDDRGGRAVARQHGVESRPTTRPRSSWTTVDAVDRRHAPRRPCRAGRLALEAGKHVLCEKPLAIRPDDARLLALRADELRLRLATGLNHRFYPPVARRPGAGRRRGRSAGSSASAPRSATGPRPTFLASWHTDVDRSGGGTLMDNGPHACDLIRRFLGEVVAAKGYFRQSARPAARVRVGGVRPLPRPRPAASAEVRSSWTQPTGYLTHRGPRHRGLARGRDGPLAADGRARERAGGSTRATWPSGWPSGRFRGLFGCERSLVREVEAFVVGPIGGQPRLEATRLGRLPRDRDDRRRLPLERDRARRSRSNRRSSTCRRGRGAGSTGSDWA